MIFNILYSKLNNSKTLVKINMEQAIEKNTVFRYERKFTVSSASRGEIISRIKNHPAFFREIFAPRQVNNIYFDTPALKFYRDNEIGISERKKVRVRWYGELFQKIGSPKLEYKIKSGLLGTKWTFEVQPFEMKEKFSTAFISSVLDRSYVPKPILEDLKMLSPSLINCYKRTYFLSADKQFRLTFDEDLSYYRVATFHPNILRKKEQENAFVIELKYSEESDEMANLITSRFPYRLDKSSKYVNGIHLTRIKKG